MRLYLPHDFDERKKYPLLINVYAGPNSQQVRILMDGTVQYKIGYSTFLCQLQVNDRFKLDWGTYLTTSEQVRVTITVLRD